MGKKILALPDEAKVDGEHPFALAKAAAAGDGNLPCVKADR